MGDLDSRTRRTEVRHKPDMSIPAYALCYPTVLYDSSSRSTICEMLFYILLYQKYGNISILYRYNLVSFFLISNSVSTWNNIPSVGSFFKNLYLMFDFQ